jgi:HTH-like domain
VQRACLMLGVSVSGYYDWKLRPPSPKTLRHAWLAGEIAQVHKDSGGTYGTLRVTAELRYGRGIHVGKEQVHLLMKRLGIYGLPETHAISLSGLHHKGDNGARVSQTGFQPEGHRSRPRALGRRCRRPVRQCDGRGVLGPHAGRATQPQKMENPHRTSHSDPRLHRDLAQRTQTPQRPEHAHTQRIRKPTPPTRDRRLNPNTQPQESQVRSKPPSKPAWLSLLGAPEHGRPFVGISCQRTPSKTPVH